MTCEACQGEGQRASDELPFRMYRFCARSVAATLQPENSLAVKYKGQSIADLLEMQVSDAGCPIIENIHSESKAADAGVRRLARTTSGASR